MLLLFAVVALAAAHAAAVAAAVAATVAAAVAAVVWPGEPHDKEHPEWRLNTSENFLDTNGCSNSHRCSNKQQQ